MVILTNPPPPRIMLISIVIPVFNDVRVGRALDSVLSQQHGRELELIVVDSGSTDGTLEVLNRYRDRISVLISEPDRGIFDGINKGIRRANGGIVGILGADDCYGDKWVLRDAVNVIETTGADGCYGDLVYIDDNGNIVRYWKAGAERRWKWRLGWQIPHFTVFFRRSVHGRFGFYDLDFPISADYEFLLRIVFLRRIRLEYIDRVMVKMILGGNSNRIGNIIKARKEVERAWKKNGVHGGALISCLKPAWKLVQYVRPRRFILQKGEQAPDRRSPPQQSAGSDAGV